jgi:hypothetical protein
MSPHLVMKLIKAGMQIAAAQSVPKDAQHRTLIKTGHLAEAIRTLFSK